MSDRRAEVLALAETVGTERIADELIRAGATWGCPREWAEQSEARFIPQVCPFSVWPKDDAAWDAQYERQSAHCENGERPGECWATITLLLAQEAKRDGKDA